MTTRELRNLLFHVENQDMTIKELRLRLFDEEKQDEELSPQSFKIITNTHTQSPFIPNYSHIPSNPTLIINRDYDDNEE